MYMTSYFNSKELHAKLMKISFCKRQYIYLALAIISLCIALTTHVFAQEPTTETVPTTIEEVREERQALREERRSELSTAAQDRITNLVRNTAGRFESAITRLTNIADRFDTRIAKLKAADIDTTQAEASVGEARIALGTARTSVQDGQTHAIAALTTDTPKASFKAAHDEFIAAHESIRSALSALREALFALKNGTPVPVIDTVTETPGPEMETNPTLTQ